MEQTQKENIVSVTLSSIVSLSCRVKKTVVRIVTGQTWRTTLRPKVLKWQTENREWAYL